MKLVKHIAVRMQLVTVAVCCNVFCFRHFIGFSEHICICEILFVFLLRTEGQHRILVHTGCFEHISLERCPCGRSFFSPYRLAVRVRCFRVRKPRELLAAIAHSIIMNHTRAIVSSFHHNLLFRVSRAAHNHCVDRAFLPVGQVIHRGIEIRLLRLRRAG